MQHLAVTWQKQAVSRVSAPGNCDTEQGLSTASTSSDVQPSQLLLTGLKCPSRPQAEQYYRSTAGSRHGRQVAEGQRWTQPSVCGATAFPRESCSRSNQAGQLSGRDSTLAQPNLVQWPVSRSIAVSPLQPRLSAAHWRCAGAHVVQQSVCPSQGWARAAVMLASPGDQLVHPVGVRLRQQAWAPKALISGHSGAASASTAHHFSAPHPPQDDAVCQSGN